MSARRTLIIIVAVAIAAVAAVANVLYLNGVQDRANKHAKLLKVYVVAKDIPKGTAGETAIDQGFIKSSQIPETFRPATALSDISVIRGKVALTALATGEVIVDGQFVEPIAAQVTFSQRIPPGDVAVTFQFDPLKALGGVLVPGDKVDMIVPFSPTKPGTAPSGAVEPGGVETVFYQNVPILSIGGATAPTPGQTAAVSAPGGGTITLALPPNAIMRIMLIGAANITLALVPPDNQPTQIPSIDPSNLFAGGLTPVPTP